MSYDKDKENTTELPQRLSGILSLQRHGTDYQRDFVGRDSVTKAYVNQ